MDDEPFGTPIIAIPRNLHASCVGDVPRSAQAGGLNEIQPSGAMRRG